MPSQELLGHALTAGSLLIAVATFAIGFLSKRKSDRLNRTWDFIRVICEEDGPIREANLELAEILSSENPEEIDGYKLPDSKRKTLITLLDYYDLISDAANRGIVDSDMISIHLGGKMRSVFVKVHGYISQTREKLDRPKIYKPYETFVTRLGNRQV